MMHDHTKHVHADLAGRQNVGARPAQDPVCGMTVNPASAAAEEDYAGTRYFFCCAGCATKFRADPRRSLPPAKAEPPPASGTPYTCPMHPEVRQNGPGACPKCGMALEPVSPAPAAQSTEWVCPMRPEIVRDRPGSSPICGMALEPRTPAD